MQCGRHRFSASWFDEHEHRDPASQNMLLRCQRKTVLRSNQSALLILLADYAMGDKLCSCMYQEAGLLCAYNSSKTKRQATSDVTKLG